MRYRIFDGQIGNFREWGVHTAATVVLRGIDLHPEDEELVKNSTDVQLILKHMPRHLIVESDIPLESQCVSLPKNHFPMKRGTTYWDLSNDPGEQYKVKSEWFPGLFDIQENHIRQANL